MSQIQTVVVTGLKISKGEFTPENGMNKDRVTITVLKMCNCLAILILSLNLTLPRHHQSQC